MENKEGFLDDIEELVSDFQKKKSLLKDINTLDYYRQKYPKEIEYNYKIQSKCKCGINYIIYINQNKGRETIFFDYTKNFFCIKCAALNYIKINSPFEIVSIKHDENFKI